MRAGKGGTGAGPGCTGHAETRTITLEDGTTITADAAVDLEALAAGDEVTITVDDTTTSATSGEQNDGM